MDVPQELSLQSWWQMCKSTAHAAVGRDFSLLPKLRGPWGSAVVSALPLFLGNLLASAPGSTEPAVGAGAGEWRRRLQWRPHFPFRVPLNSGASLLWWTRPFSTNTPGCGCATLQPLQAVCTTNTSHLSGSVL